MTWRELKKLVEDNRGKEDDVVTLSGFSMGRGEVDASGIHVVNGEIVIEYWRRD